MLRPRSFTFFVGKEDGTVRGRELLLDMMSVAKKMTKQGLQPRTLRLTLPVIELDRSEDLEADFELATHWFRLARDCGFRWVNQPVFFGINGEDSLNFSHNLVALLSKYDTFFSALHLRSLESAKAGALLYAKTCKSLGRADSEGFANFRFGLGLNSREYTPFFPFAYGRETSVSVAVESLPLALGEIEGYSTLDRFGTALCAALERSQEVFVNAVRGSAVRFQGQDWSLAPLPNSKLSVASLIERVSGNPLGAETTLHSIAMLTAQLKKPVLDPGIADTGFNGVMLSVLEDDVLAKRFSSRVVSINQLLLYSAVCGCGIDMVPLAGDASERSISGYSVDAATLAYRLGKPLGVRFLPISNLQAGQGTSFNHDFVTNADVISP